MNMTGTRAAAGGAFDFKGWYTVVWLTPGVVHWPRRCACCGRRPEGTAEAKDGELVVARYPICRPCRRHAKVDDVAMLVALAVSALTVVGGWLAMFGPSIMNRIGIQLVVMFVAFIVITGCVYWLLGHFAGSKLPRCPDDGWPVETYSPAGFGIVLGKDAERTDEKELRSWCSQAALELGAGATLSSCAIPSTRAS